MTGDALVIDGERKEEHEEKRGGAYRRECSYRHFHRTAPLPPGVKPDWAHATFRNGVLEVVMPAPGLTVSQARRIKIKEG